MSLRITRSPQALIDVIERAYYVSDNAGLNASDNFLKAVESAYKQLADMPGDRDRLGHPPRSARSAGY